MCLADWINLLNLAKFNQTDWEPVAKNKSAMAMSICSVACGSCLVPMSVICCILGGSEVADFHLLLQGEERDIELANKVDAAIEDGDSLYFRFCLDSLFDHIAAKVFAPEMNEELLIVV